jgi:hypothetical protein
VTGREPVQQKWQQLRDNAGFKGLRWLAWLQRFRPMARVQAAPGFTRRSLQGGDRDSITRGLNANG